MSETAWAIVQVAFFILCVVTAGIGAAMLLERVMNGEWQRLPWQHPKPEPKAIPADWSDIFEDYCHHHTSVPWPVLSYGDVGTRRVTLVAWLCECGKQRQDFKAPLTQPPPRLVTKQPSSYKSRPAWNMSDKELLAWADRRIREIEKTRRHTHEWHYVKDYTGFILAAYCDCGAYKKNPKAKERSVY